MTRFLTRELSHTPAENERWRVVDVIVAVAIFVVSYILVFSRYLGLF